VGRGELRKLVVGVYTTLVDAEPAEVVRRNIYQVLGALYKKAVISGPVILEVSPSTRGLWPFKVGKVPAKAALEDLGSN
jgi:hypothetical protein